MRKAEREKRKRKEKKERKKEREKRLISLFFSFSWLEVCLVNGEEEER